MGELLKRKYQVRRASVYGKEVTLAPDTLLQPGDTVVQIYDGFVLIVPIGTEIDEDLLKKAIMLKK
jgi:hypothetical protein